MSLGKFPDKLIQMKALKRIFAFCAKIDFFPRDNSMVFAKVDFFQSVNPGFLVKNNQF